MSLKATLILALAAVGLATPQRPPHHETCTPHTVTAQATTCSATTITETFVPAAVTVTKVSTKVETLFSTKTSVVVSTTIATATATATVRTLNIVGFEDSLCGADPADGDFGDSEEYQIELPIPTIPAGAADNSVLGECQNFDDDGTPVSSLQFDDSLHNGSTIPATCVLRVFTQLGCRDPAEQRPIELNLVDQEVCRDKFSGVKSARIIC